MIETGSTSDTEQGTVRNALIYLSDSLRYDYLSDFEEELGVASEAISPSTFTGTTDRPQQVLNQSQKDLPKEMGYL